VVAAGFPVVATTSAGVAATLGYEYQAAPVPERREVHRALAEATDARLDPDRRAWHRARAADGPDEAVAAELERSADRAHARGGLSAAAAFLERAAELTPDPAMRVKRSLAAAQAKLDIADTASASDLLAAAELGPVDELQHARLQRLRAQIAFTNRRGRDAPPLLLEAARRLDPLDAVMAQSHADASRSSTDLEPAPGSDLTATRAAGRPADSASAREPPGCGTSGSSTRSSPTPRSRPGTAGSFTGASRVSGSKIKREIERQARAQRRPLASGHSRPAGCASQLPV